MNQPMPMQATRWRWMVAIWSGIALFDAAETVMGMRADGMHHAWGRLFLTELLCWLPFALMTPLILRLGRKYPPTRLRPLSTWAVHVSACLALNTVVAAWMAWLTWELNPFAVSPAPPPYEQLWFTKFYGGLVITFMLYGAIVAVGHMLNAQERLAWARTETARLNEQLSKAQLEALRRQIEPHFLFNTLNSIAGLVREKKNDAAVSMIVRLSEFLRRVTDNSDRQLVPLAEEMEFVERYLEIQKVRFAERLQLSVEVPGDLLPAQVPSLLLQPIVENAIKHGIAKRAQGGAIRISAARNNGTLTIKVYNDGPGMPAGWETEQSGVGIANVRTRMQGLYGPTFGLDVRNEATSGVEVSVSVPYREG